MRGITVLMACAKQSKSRTDVYVPRDAGQSQPQSLHRVAGIDNFKLALTPTASVGSMPIPIGLICTRRAQDRDRYLSAVRHNQQWLKVHMETHLHFRTVFCPSFCLATSCRCGKCLRHVRSRDRLRTDHTGCVVISLGQQVTQRRGLQPPERL